jgi:hypothetical protein
LAEQEAAAAAPVEQVAAEPVQQGLSLAEEIAAIVSLRERGALVTPAGSNAFDSVMALRQRYPDADELRPEARVVLTGDPCLALPLAALHAPAGPHRHRING